MTVNVFECIVVVKITYCPPSVFIFWSLPYLFDLFFDGIWFHKNTIIREYFLMYKYKQISITIRYVFIYTLLCNVPRKSIADFWDTYQDGCKKRTMSRDYHFYFVKKGICNSRLNMYNKIPWKEEYNGVTWVAEVKFNQI